MSNDRISHHEDWKDGMNQFRLRMYQDLEVIYKQLQLIQERLDEQDRD